MGDQGFAWTTELTKKLFILRFENDLLFKKSKQPWSEFRKILLENGFPKAMSVNHVRKKWSYTYDCYKIAKKTNNKHWKYYKMFDKHFGKTKILDKYEYWTDEWRLKLITCISEAKEALLDFRNMWRVVESALRVQDLPIECCIQDIKGLWHHIKMIFNRKHRMSIRKGAELTQWPLYNDMLEYFKKHEPNYLTQFECDTIYDSATHTKARSRKNKHGNREERVEEFQWSKDITESFIQIRLQHDWLFRERKWAWNDLRTIMVEEYGFPKTLTGRELCRKWASTFGEYQKSKAKGNKSWVYYSLFEVYLGEESLSLNPLVGWQEEWVHNLIRVRSELENVQSQKELWRKVEKALRKEGIPLDHSLLDLPEIWMHLVKTYGWKRKFANKGILNEKWPYFDAMTKYSEMRKEVPLKKQKVYKEGYSSFDDAYDNDNEDDVKLFDLKQRLSLVKPKAECIETSLCRSCSSEEGAVSIFEQKDEEGINLAHKLKLIGGVEVEESDSLPSQMCLNCLRELDSAYKFRRKCQEIDKTFRSNPRKIKLEVAVSKEDEEPNDYNDSQDLDTDVHFEENQENQKWQKPLVKVEGNAKRKKKVRKLRYDYWKICEICGKPTRNLISHLDMHSKDKGYSCDICEKRFKFKSGLVIHKAVHNPTPKKTCEVCGKTFHIVAQYRRHFVYHANERKYGCETCGKRFNTLDILRVHNRSHTDERPFTCQDCGKRFRTAGCVSRHKRIVHRNVKGQKS